MSLHKLIFPGGSQLLLQVQPIRDLFTPESPGEERGTHTLTHTFSFMVLRATDHLSCS